MKKIICFGIVAFGFMFGVNAAEWNPQELNSCPLQGDIINNGEPNSSNEPFPDIENKLEDSIQ